MDKAIYDVIIIGAGPAGLTAGIFARARDMKTLIIGSVLGGQAATTPLVENYPGTECIDGYKMMKDWERQAKNDGAEIKYDTVEKIEEKEGKTFIVKTADESYECKSVIIAYGKTPRVLGVPGEEEFTGKGVSYCVSCDGPLFKGKTVAVVGGGNSALEAALVMSHFGKKVYIINNSEKFTGFENFQISLKSSDNVEILHNTETREILGDKMVNAIEIENLKTKEKRKIEVDGVFVEIGYDVDTRLLEGLVKLDKLGQIVITNRCETYCPDSDKIKHGIFAAGDITNTPFKQIVVAAGEGAKASLQAYNCIHGIG
jgi:thioredoxin-disulfide reductase